MSGITCGFIGMGLIGGSIAKALKESVPEVKIIAFDANQETLRLAAEEHIADVTADSINESFASCDYLFLCAPVSKNDENLSAVCKIIKPGCLLTDVGSVKNSIHEAVHAAGLDHCFIGGHPMAGSERTGYVNSRASILENAYYILTPTASVPCSLLEGCQKLVEQIGAIPLILEPRQHDYITAAVSHVPHVIAASLVNLVRRSDSEDGVMKMIAAGGFKDITRIASSSSSMWQQICLSNKDNICSLLKDYIGALTRFEDMLERQDAPSVYAQFEKARVYRDSFLNASSGPIKRVYCIYVDIADKTGALAAIATRLAESGLNIKNIGIAHNRESEDGVLRVEFYDEAAMTAAAGYLSADGYAVAVRSLD